MEEPDRPCTLMLVYSVTYTYKRESKKKSGPPPTGIRVAEVEVLHFSFTKDNWIPPSFPPERGV